MATEMHAAFVCSDRASQFVRLSIIIPGCNNPEAWWKRCVLSVLDACGACDEVICVDDGSVKAVRYEWFPDPRVKVLRKENGGLSSARNAGLKVAKGEYIGFVDSDDAVLPDAFNRCIRKLEDTGSDICIYGVRVIWPNDGLYKDDTARDRFYGLLRPGDLKDLYERCLFNYACNKVYRRGFLSSKNLVFDPDGMPCEDVVFNLCCVMQGAKWCSVDYIGYVYYRTRGTILSLYKKTGYSGIRLGMETWRRYAKVSHAQGEELRWIGRCIDRCNPLAHEWHNIWLPQAPYSAYGRWKWLRENMPQYGVIVCIVIYLKMLVRQIVRRHFYIRLLRRMNTKLTFPSAKNWQGAHE